MRGCKRLVESGFVPWASSDIATWSWWVPEGEDESCLNRYYAVMKCIYRISHSRCGPRQGSEETRGTGYVEDDGCSGFETAAEQDLESSERDKAGSVDCSHQSDGMMDHYVVIEFHVCYSASYQDPVLYMHAYMDSGTVLGMQDIKEYCIQVVKLRCSSNSTRKNIIGDIEWPMMTQESHPVTQVPCYMVHPCDTGDVMKRLLQGDVRGPKESGRYGMSYLMAWLSIVGQPFGLVPSVKDMKECVMGIDGTS